VGSYGILRADAFVVSRCRDGVSPELLAVFRDDMLRTRRVPARQYYDDEDEGDAYVDVVEFFAPGQQIADRLDVIGINSLAACAALNWGLAGRSGLTRDPAFLAQLDDDLQAQIDQENALLDSLDAEGWIERLKETQHDPPQADDRLRLGTRSWLLSQLDYWDERFALRLVLLAFPDAQVRLDVTALAEGGWIEGEPTALASNALESLRTDAAALAPTVVLTEGRTDAEFLSAALKILYPHLTDLVRFLDYAGRPEGGVGALVRLVRSFAAAGIANKVVALFDNDAAAADGLRLLDAARLPPNIRVVRYPDTALATDYPTLGPPTSNTPSGSLNQANVNGLAGSIELYLGRDVLTLPEGKLSPVQWKSFVPGVNRYQGEVTGKTQIQDAFRKKYARALQDPMEIGKQDWDGLRAILTAVLSAFAEESLWRPPPT
jgi:hypothetical protein